MSYFLFIKKMKRTTRELHVILIASVNNLLHFLRNIEINRAPLSRRKRKKVNLYYSPIKILRLQRIVSIWNYEVKIQFQVHPHEKSNKLSLFKIRKVLSTLKKRIKVYLNWFMKGKIIDNVNRTLIELQPSLDDEVLLYES